MARAHPLRTVGPKPLSRYRINGGAWVESRARRYGIRYPSGKVVWYHEADPRVRALLAIGR